MVPTAVLFCIVSTVSIEARNVRHQAVAITVQSPLRPCYHADGRSLHLKNGSALHNKSKSAIRMKNLQSGNNTQPEGGWETEDFNPENAPGCGSDEPEGMNTPSSAAGDEDLVVPQKQVIEALKKVCGEMTKDTSDSATACAKLDADGKDDISKEEFDNWLQAQPHLKPTVRDENMRDALFDAFSGGKDTISASRCKAVVKEHGTVLSLHLRAPH